MRVLFFDFITSPGGVTSVVRTLLIALKDRVDLRFIDPYDGPVSHGYAAAGIPVAKLRIWPRVRAVGWNQRGRRLFALLTLGPSYLLYLFRLAWWIRSREIDVVYVSFTKSLFVAWLCRVICPRRFRLVYQAHGFRSAASVPGWMRRAILAADAVIAVSDHVRDILLELGVPEERCTRIHNAIALPPAVPAPPIGRFRVLVPASIQENKGQHVLLESLRQLIAEGVEVAVDFAGEPPPGADGSYMNRLTSFARQHQLESHSRFLGWRADIAELMAAANCVVLPSVHEESFGLVLAEAMALGRPVIGSRLGGIREVVAHGVTGFLFEPGNAEELASLLGLLARDSALQERLGRSGRQWAHQHFSVETMADEVVTVLHRVLDR